MKLREGTAGAAVETRPDFRKAKRTAYRLAVRAAIYPLPGCEAETPKHTHVLSHDLSGNAISIVYSKALCVGQRVDLELPDGQRSSVVCRVEKMEDGHFLIVCRFNENDR